MLAVSVVSKAASGQTRAARTTQGRLPDCRGQRPEEHGDRVADAEVADKSKARNDLRLVQSALQFSIYNTLIYHKKYPTHIDKKLQFIN